MSRQPFISSDLRPDMTVESQQTLDGCATTMQLADAVSALLSEEERRQVARGRQAAFQRMMEAVPKPNPNVQGSTLDGETVLLDLITGRYYTLNRIGSAIWERCTGSHSLHDIHTGLCDKYEASAERIADDLLALVTQLGHEGLLTLEAR